jgi:hypothetical protein
METVAFGFELSSKADRPKGKPPEAGDQPARVALSFAPLSSDGQASATSPIPRFAEPADAYVPLPRR